MSVKNHKLNCTTKYKISVQIFKPHTSKTKTTKLIFIPPPTGMKELKWNLYELIDKAGLRKDTLLEKEGIEEEDAFKFYTATFSEPMVYGYRSVILTYDRVRQVYRQHTKEMEVFDEEVMHRYDDFHRTYPPYYRLFATRAFERLGLWEF